MDGITSRLKTTYSTFSQFVCVMEVADRWRLKEIIFGGLKVLRGKAK